MVEYKEFQEFHKKHPDLDNAEYYAEFPETNKSTIRSWKLRANKPISTAPPLPTEPIATALGSTWEDEMIKMLCTQTGTPYNEFEGVDNKSALIVLKARLSNVQSEEPEKPTKTGNTPILPVPKPIGASVRKFGLDEYIVFDDVKDEIRMEIPWDVLMDPEKNKALGEIK